MISDKRHSEMDSGRFVYVVEMPERGKCLDHNHPEFDRTLWKVKFWNGIGKTVHRTKAQRFDEQLGYIIHIHKKDIPWVNASNEKEVPNEAIDDEPHMYIDNDDEEE